MRKDSFGSVIGLIVVAAIMLAISAFVFQVAYNASFVELYGFKKLTYETAFPLLITFYILGSMLKPWKGN